MNKADNNGPELLERVAPSSFGLMEHAEYVDAIRREGDALATAAVTRGVDAPVPSCPDWNVADLLGHVGRMHRWVDAHRRSRAAAPSATLVAMHEPPPAERDRLVRRGRAELADALRVGRADDEVWSWTPDHRPGSGPAARRTRPRCTAGTRRRRGGAPQPIERELAVDGIDEFFDLMPFWLAAESPAGAGETIHLHCTDGEGEWLVRLAPDGTSVTREHAKGDVAARATARGCSRLMSSTSGGSCTGCCCRRCRWGANCTWPNPLATLAVMDPLWPGGQVSDHDLESIRRVVHVHGQVIAGVHEQILGGSGVKVAAVESHRVGWRLRDAVLGDEREVHVLDAGLRQAAGVVVPWSGVRVAATGCRC